MKELKKVKFIIVHATDTPPSMNVTRSHLEQWHVNDNGWDDIGYHWFINKDGHIDACRDEKYQGAHCKGFNDRSLGVALEGGWQNIDDFTTRQRVSLFGLIKRLKNKYGGNVAVVGHNHFDDLKECPCFNVVEDYEHWLRTGLV